MSNYENTTFWCWTCFHTGHLQNPCPQARKATTTKKSQASKQRGWQFHDSLEDEKEEDEENQPNFEPQTHFDGNLNDKEGDKSRSPVTTQTATQSTENMVPE